MSERILRSVRQGAMQVDLVERDDYRLFQGDEPQEVRYFVVRQWLDGTMTREMCRLTIEERADLVRALGMYEPEGGVRR